MSESSGCFESKLTLLAFNILALIGICLLVFDRPTTTPSDINNNNFLVHKDDSSLEKEHSTVLLEETKPKMLTPNASPQEQFYVLLKLQKLHEDLDSFPRREYTAFFKELVSASQGYRVTDVPGNGHCFFFAVAACESKSVPSSLQDFYEKLLNQLILLNKQNSEILKEAMNGILTDDMGDDAISDGVEPYTVTPEKMEKAIRHFATYHIDGRARVSTWTNAQAFIPIIESMYDTKKLVVLKIDDHDRILYVLSSMHESTMEDVVDDIFYLLFVDGNHYKAFYKEKLSDTFNSTF